MSHLHFYLDRTRPVSDAYIYTDNFETQVPNEDANRLLSKMNQILAHPTLFPATLTPPAAPEPGLVLDRGDFTPPHEEWDQDVPLRDYQMAIKMFNLDFGARFVVAGMDSSKNTNQARTAWATICHLSGVTYDPAHITNRNVLCTGAGSVIFPSTV